MLQFIVLGKSTAGTVESMFNFLISYTKSVVNDSYTNTFGTKWNVRKTIKNQVNQINYN